MKQQFDAYLSYYIDLYLMHILNIHIIYIYTHIYIYYINICILSSPTRIVVHIGDLLG